MATRLAWLCFERRAASSWSVELEGVEGAGVGARDSLDLDFDLRFFERELSELESESPEEPEEVELESESPEDMLPSLEERDDDRSRVPSIDFLEMLV